MEIDFDDSSHFENLPYDVFSQLIITSSITGEELVNLCKSSSRVDNMCHHKNDALFKKFASKFDVVEMYKPFEEIYKYFEISYWNNNFDFIVSNPSTIDLIIPDIVLEFCARKFGISVELLIRLLLEGVPGSKKLGVFYNHYNLDVLDENGKEYVHNKEFDFSTVNLPKFESDVYGARTVDKLSILCKLNPSKNNPNSERYIVDGILFNSDQLAILTKFLKLTKDNPQAAERHYRKSTHQLLNDIIG